MTLHSFLPQYISMLDDAPPDATRLAARSLSSAGWSHTFFSTERAASAEPDWFSAAFTGSDSRKACTA